MDGTDELDCAHMSSLRQRDWISYAQSAEPRASGPDPEQRDRPIDLRNLAVLTVSDEHSVSPGVHRRPDRAKVIRHRHEAAQTRRGLEGATHPYRRAPDP